MKIVVLMDSLKGSLTSTQAGEAVKEGILASQKDANVAVYPFADGGEGSLDAFLTADGNGRKVCVNVSDPLGRPVDACYGILSDGTVVIEIAQAAGLCHLSQEERNPLVTSTKGVGELIRAAAEDGYRSFLVTLGGSATNDCGLGMLRALGYEFTDENDHPVAEGAQGLSDVYRINDENVLSCLDECTFLIAGDVSNPLYGEQGASAVFGPQKGASKDDVTQMELWMRHFAKIVQERYSHADPFAQGAGAAGGLGFAFQTFLKGTFRPGAQMLLDRTGLEQKIAACDLVITGEGRIDAQTVMGKAPIRIAQVAKKYGKPVIAIAGCLGDGAKECLSHGIDLMIPAVSGSKPDTGSLEHDRATENIKRAAQEAIEQYLKQ